MAETLENQALHNLGQIIDEKHDQNIVSLGMVKSINEDNGKIDCILEFNDIDQNRNDKIVTDAKKTLEEIPGITKVNIVTTYPTKTTQLKVAILRQVKIIISVFLKLNILLPLPQAKVVLVNQLLQSTLHLHSSLWVLKLVYLMLISMGLQFLK